MATPRSHGVTLDWNAQNWAAGALVQEFETDPANPGPDVRITARGADGESIPTGTLAIGTQFSGGLVPAPRSLVYAPPGSLKVTFTIEFLYPDGVSGARFALYDVDTGSTGYGEAVSRMLGNGSNRTVTPTLSGGYAAITSGYESSRVVTGFNAAPDNSGTGTLTIDFRRFPIRSCEFTVAGSGPAVALSNIIFTPVPRAEWRTPSFTPIDGLNDLPDANSRATAVSADGLTVVGYGIAGSITPQSPSNQAFRWTEGTGMQILGGKDSAARAVSADGKIVAGDIGGSPSDRQAVRWDANGTPVLLPPLRTGARDFANAISADGSIIVGSEYFPDPLSVQATRWINADTPENLSLQPADYQQPQQCALFGLSADGSVAVGEGGGLGIVSIGGAPATVMGFASRFTAVSPDGSVAAGYVSFDAANTGYLFLDRALSLFRRPEDTSSTPLAIAGDNATVVGYGTQSLNGVLTDQAERWTPARGWERLGSLLTETLGLTDAAGWTLQRATAITPDASTIVGWGTDPGGNTRAWRAQLPPPSSETPALQTVSVATNGIRAGSGAPSTSRPGFSADGRFIAFESAAENLVPNDTNGVSDIFIRDLQTGETERVSVRSGNVQANGPSRTPAISGDGRFVAFASLASNLAASGADTNGAWDIFCYDRLNRTLAHLSPGRSGSSNAASYFPVISDGPWGGGAFVFFESDASNLVTGDTNAQRDIFRSSVFGGSPIRVTVTSEGGEPNGFSTSPSISRDGRWLAYASTASNLVPGDTNGKSDIFVQDLAGLGDSIFSPDSNYLGVLRVSISNTGAQAAGDCFGPVISADGAHVAYFSTGHNLVTGFGESDPSLIGKASLFVRDFLFHGRTELLLGGPLAEPGSSQRVSISDDGQVVAFETTRAFGNDADSNNGFDVYVYRRGATAASLISRTPAGLAGNGQSLLPILSSDGRNVAFLSDATNLVGNDSNGARDVFYCPTSTVEFAASSYSVRENDGAVVITARRIGDLGRRASIHYTSTGGTASPYVDYEGQLGLLDFAPGESTKTFAINILPDDSEEANETFNVRLFSEGSDEPASGVTTVTIVSDDSPVEKVFGHGLYFSYINSDDIYSYPKLTIRNPGATPSLGGYIEFYETLFPESTFPMKPELVARVTVPSIPAGGTVTVSPTTLDTFRGNSQEGLNASISAKLFENTPFGAVFADLIQHYLGFSSGGAESGATEARSQPPGNQLPTLQSVSISGPTQLLEGTTADFRFTATMSDGSARSIANPVWKSSQFAISPQGRLTAGEVAATSDLTVTVGVTVDGITKMAARPVKVVNVVPRVTLLTTVDSTREAVFAAPARFAVKRSGSTSQSLKVRYTVGGTATSGSDYVALSGEAVIPAGSAATDIDVTPLVDTVFEPNETVIVTLVSDPLYQLGSEKSGTVTIIGSISVQWSQGATTCSEGVGDIFLQLYRLGRTDGTLQVTLEPVDESARVGLHYQLLTPSVEFADGADTAAVKVHLIDDAVINSRRAFQVRISTAGGDASIGSPAVIAVGVSDDELSSFAAFAGKHLTLLSSESGAADAFGLLTVQLSAGGMFTAQGRRNATSFTCRGRFDPQGVGPLRSLPPPLPAGSTLRLNLNRDSLNLEAALTVPPAAEMKYVLKKSPYSSRNAAPHAGRYTAALFDPAAADLTAGVTSLRISPAGVVTTAGSLHDGATVSCTTALLENGSIPIYAAPYGRGGAIAGILSIAADSHAPAGQLKWLRPPRPNKVPSESFEGPLALEASLYTPSARLSVLDFSATGGRGTLHLTRSADAGAADSTFGVRFAPRYQLLASDRAPLTFRLASGTGLLSGRLAPRGEPLVSLHGAILQRQNAARGFATVEGRPIGFFVIGNANNYK